MFVVDLFAGFVFKYYMRKTWYSVSFINCKFARLIDGTYVVMNDMMTQTKSCEI